MSRVLGAVLAGGRSHRFGSDKANARLDGRRLIDRAIDGLAPQVDAVIVCGREVPGYVSVPDCPAADLGPLGGLNAAMHYAREHDFETVVAVPCDVPFLPSDLAVRLASAGASAYLPNLPVIGRWPSSLAALLDHHLATSADRSMRFWATVAGAHPVHAGELANVNTPADLHRIASGSSPL
ncbi:molybdenum cofactor guanylyltransferase [Sphingomonas bacterium]|uniref:molybdenum cofactor guanylyltransferase n=1 Tax=Sphingomonas bacterium TaxID=1895847 RepID=UPI00261EF94F|nr:molybdenum cofactor guanylyltransferase [Sphingomonas bacterium]MDB5678512.1 molybdenum cofactor guanylyltransferase [Sphingomonas bacterium]